MDIFHRDVYDNVVTSELKNFHKSRIMFALIGEQGFHKEYSESSHAEWFIQEGWIKDINDPEFETIIRGYFNPYGIFFYKGIGFSELEDKDFDGFNICIEYLKPLIKYNLPVFSGLNSHSQLTVYTPKTSLGRINDLPKDKFNFDLVVQGFALLGLKLES